MINIISAMTDPQLFGPWFRGKTWDAWRAYLAALFGLPMDQSQLEIFARHTGRAQPPAAPVAESWLVVGRRGGKSLIAAATAVFCACFKDYSSHLAPGEVATVMVIAADRRQARVVMRYIAGFIDNVPMLSRMVTNRTRESIDLNNRVTIEVHTASFRAVRGYTIACAILDEVAFWRSDESANPDREVLAALRPALSTIPSSLLLCISSPYARRGALWDAYRRHYAKDGDAVLLWQADTASMNPSADLAIIAQAYADDAPAAAAEYGAEFRRDVETYISRETVEACVGDYTSRAFDSQYLYRAFIDAAGGSGQDSYCLAIAHNEGECAVIDVVREVKPRFNPEQVTAEYCDLLKAFSINRVYGDKYAGSWPSEQFRKRGVHYEPADKSKSQLYVDCLPLLTAGRVELPNNPRLIAQFCALERRTSRGTGRDTIDHPPNSHDDLANVCAGVLAGTPVKKLVQRLY